MLAHADQRKEKPAIIYGLTDEYGLIRYVGKTVNPKSRFNAHKRSISWFAVSGMAILESVKDRQGIGMAEKKWIAFFGRDCLLNRTDGGASWANPPSQDHVRNIAIGLKKRWEDSESRIKLSERLRHILNTPDIKEKMISNARVKASSPAFRRKLVEAAVIKSKNLAYREKLSIGLKKYWASEENRKRQSDALKSACKDGEMIKRRVAKLRETLSTPEGFARKSRAMKMVSAYPHVVEKRRAYLKEQWKDERYRKIMSEKLKAGWAKKRQRDDLAHVKKESV